MNVSRILDDLQMLLLKPEFLDGLASIFDQPGLELRIDPCTRDDRRAAPRSDFLRIDLDPRIDGLGVNHALLDKQAFQRLDPESRFGR